MAEAAGVNVASIAYYFGDKAGLYRAVFFEPLGPLPVDTGEPAAAAPPAPLGDELRRFYTDFLQPLKSGEDARLCIKLRFREILEPSGLWEQELAGAIRPMHEQLLRLLCHALPAAEADDDVQRLALCLSGLGREPARQRRHHGRAGTAAGGRPVLHRPVGRPHDAVRRWA